jgi:Transposase DDE domain
MTTQSKHPAWALKHRKPGTELRLIKGRYYLYAYKTIYNAITKKPQKQSGQCLGSITEHGGFKESAKILASKLSNNNGSLISKVHVREYGIAYLILKKFEIYAKQLEKSFPQYWNEILAIAYARFIHCCPLKNIPLILENSFISELFAFEAFKQTTSSFVLNTIGKDIDALHSYMKSFIKQDDYILIDGTSIASKSELLETAKVGYNNYNNYDGQINLLYIYSATTRMPIFYRILPGDIRDVKSFKNTIAMSGLTSATIIADKGFYSKANLDALIKEKMSFIIPLKRDNALIDYETIKQNTFKLGNNFFSHEKRFIWYKKFEFEDYDLYLFLDEYLRANEEHDYLTRIKKEPEECDIEKYNNKKHVFGTIALLAPKTCEGARECYTNYKSRMFIETMFDGLKNVLESDKTYMQNDDTLKGWMFINHICLQWYQELYLELKNKKLNSRISVRDYINTLTNIKKVKINDKWVLNEFTNATAALVKKIGIDIYNT